MNKYIRTIVIYLVVAAIISILCVVVWLASSLHWTVAVVVASLCIIVVGNSILKDDVYEDN